MKRFLQKMNNIKASRFFLTKLLIYKSKCKVFKMHVSERIWGLRHTPLIKINQASISESQVDKGELRM